MTEVKAAAGADVPGDLGAEMLGFVQELKAFRSEIQNRLEAQETRMTMLDRKTISRPARRCRPRPTRVRRIRRPSTPISATAMTARCAGCRWRARR